MKRLLAFVLLLALAAPASGMETILSARAVGMQGALGSVTYFPLMGHDAALTVADYAYTWFPAAGTLSDFAFYVTSAPGVGLSTAFVISKNGGSDITFSISNTDVTATPAGTITVAAGDYVYVQADPDVGVASSDVYYTCKFTSTTAGQGLITGGSGSGSASTSANRFGGLMGVAALVAGADDVRQCMPTGGTIDYLYTSYNGTALASGSYAVTLYLNGSAQTLVATLGTGGSTANDVTHSVAVSAGDLVEIGVIPSSPNAAKRIQWGVRWTPTTDGEAVLIGGSTNALDINNSEFNRLNNSAASWTTTEANYQIRWPAVELKFLTVALTAAPGTGGDSFAFTVRDDGAGTALDVTITDTATTGRDTTHSTTPAAGSLICLGVDPSVSPATPDAYWGVVAYIEPAATSRRVMVVQ